jgi:CHAT domain
MTADPVKRTVLLLAANPASTETLDLRTEYEAIEQCLKRTPNQHTLSVVAKDAVTDDDLRRALLDYEPEIVHFSGHGTGRRGLVFEEVGEPLFISGDALSGLLGLCSTHVKCVVLNACYSEVQARSISSVVEYVIGMSRAIGDIAATKFSTGFYDSLASGRSYTDAFHFGCNAISLRGIPESLTPTLIVKSRVQTDGSLADADDASDCEGASIRQGGHTLDPSVQELISLLDFRADMVLSMMEKEQREASEPYPSKPRSPAGGGSVENKSQSARDMKSVNRKVRFDEYAAKFAELHEQNKKALITGHFVLSHEITGQIQLLLYAFNTVITSPVAAAYCLRWSWRFWNWRSPHEETKRMYRKLSADGMMQLVRRRGEDWIYASEYPGPLPKSLKQSQNDVVLMWKHEEEERRRAEEKERREREESARKWEAERHGELQRREAESERKRALLAVLQQAQREKGIPVAGDRCPKCGFTYGWDGLDCHHCHYHEG